MYKNSRINITIRHKFALKADTWHGIPTNPIKNPAWKNTKPNPRAREWVTLGGVSHAPPRADAASNEGIKRNPASFTMTARTSCGI